MAHKNVSVSDILKMAVEGTPPAEASAPAVPTDNNDTELVRLLEASSEVLKQFKDSTSPVKVISGLSGVIDNVINDYVKSGGQARNVLAAVDKYDDAVHDISPVSESIEAALTKVVNALGELNTAIDGMSGKLEAVNSAAKGVAEEMEAAWKSDSVGREQ
jgi:methyl-accepting chemotaxis protein